jgi:hypothetical protein
MKRLVVKFMPLPLYPEGEKPPVPNGREHVWPQKSVWKLWIREKSLALTGIRTPVVPIVELYLHSTICIHGVVLN